MIDEQLAALADARGVLTRYDDWLGRPVDVPEQTVRAVLAALEPEPPLPLPIVARRGRSWRVPADPESDVSVLTEEGATVELGRDSDGWRELPADLPTGYHRLRAGDDDTLLIASPEACPAPPDQRLWGWMVQLYAVRSGASWGLGDLADLAALARWSGAGLGAGFVLCNPLHASAPTLPQEPSPYLPTTRRFANWLYVRVEELPELGSLDPADRSRITELAAAARATNRDPQLDRDAVFRRKLAALELLHSAPRSTERESAYADFRARGGAELEDFATFSAVAEVHGLPWQEWPAELRHPRSAAVARARTELATRVDLHAWLQWLCDQQLATAQSEARAAGMPVGVIHDLAVGVDPGGADAWALQDDSALGMSVGAPPDEFNRTGQDWTQPPLRPDRLAASGFRPYRYMLRSVLRQAGGVRVDHAAGLFRLFWIPRGGSPTEGTYVRYPADALLAVLAIETHRAAAIAIAEDLGTIPPGVTETLRDWGLLSSAVLWFERRAEDGWRKRTVDYSVQAFASVTTHDLPTARGFWTERDGNDEDRRQLRGVLDGEGFADPAASTDDLVLALHAFVATTPAQLVGVQLSDAVGDARRQNVPGTIDEHPNWRLGLARCDGVEPPEPILLEDVMTDTHVRRVADVVSNGRARTER